MKLSIMVAIAATLAAAPAAAFEKEATTPSGRPEMVFAFTDLPTAVTAVSSECMDKGWMITSQMPNQVVCEIPMGIWQSALTQMFLGNSYSTTPKSFVRVSLAQVGDHTRAQTQAWAETQMVFGQMQQQVWNDDGTYNNMLTFLAEAGAQFPVGTTFTASAYLGVNGEATTWMDGRRSRYGHRLTTVTANGPADRMGIQLGDILGKINNRTIRDDADLTRILGRQRIGQPLAMTVIRDGAPVEIAGISEGRPTITTLVDPSLVPEGETAVGLQVAVAHTGTVENALAAIAKAKGLPAPATVAPVEVVALTPVAAESDLEKARREAAEAQARLAAMEAASAPVTTATGAQATPTP